MTKTPEIKLPDEELQQAVDKLREANRIGATCTLSDGRMLTYKGGPFGSVEIVKP